MTTTRTETITAADGQTFDGHLTVPAGGRGPGVLLLQEIFGVGEFILDRARALAELGYVVLAPDVFWRVERNVSLPHDEAALEQAFGYVGRWSTEVPDDVKLSDLRAALEHLRALPEVGGRKVAAMGYCLGGSLAFTLGCHADPDAVVSYYGSGLADRVDEAAALDCPTILHFGGNDPYIPNEQVDSIQVHLGDRVNIAVHVQQGAGHAFENSFAPMFHDPDATSRSWPITVEFLQEALA